MFGSPGDMITTKKDQFLVQLLAKALALPKSECIAHFLFSLSLGKFSSPLSRVKFSVRK